MSTHAEIVNELNSLNSPLANASREMPYQVPGDYFESFSKNITAITSERIETTQLQTVPEGYFEILPEKILARIKSGEKNTKKVISLRKNIRWAAAAILMLIIGSGIYHFAFNKVQLNPEQRLEKVSSETVNEYILHHIDEFDTEELMEYNNFATNNENAKSLILPLDKKDIIDYLNENGWENLD